MFIYEIYSFNSVVAILVMSDNVHYMYDNLDIVVVIKIMLYTEKAVLLFLVVF